MRSVFEKLSSEKISAAQAVEECLLELGYALVASCLLNCRKKIWGDESSSGKSWTAI